MNKYELKLSIILLNYLESGKSVPDQVIQMKKILIIWTVLILVIALFLLDGKYSNFGLDKFLLFVAGGCAGAAACFSLGAKQWTVIAKHLNKDSLKKIIEENQRDCE